MIDSKYNTTASKLPELASSAENHGMSRSSQPTQLVYNCGQPSPKTSYVPCDVEHLLLKNTTDDQEIGCIVEAHYDTSLSARQREKMNGADLLLECLADYENDYGDKPSKKVNLQIEAKTAPDCALQQHPLLTAKPIQNRDLVDKDHEVVIGSLAPISILAPSTRRGGSAHNKGWLAKFWNFNFNDRVKIYEVRVESCGVRPNADPVGNLTGRVLIYPNESWKLTLNIPAFKTISKTKSGSLSLSKDGWSKERASSNSSTSGWGRTGSSYAQSSTSNSKESLSTESASYTDDWSTSGFSETSGTKGETAYYSEKETETHRTAWGEEKYSFSDSTDAPMSFLGEQKLVFRPSFSLTLNGQELDISRRINNILSIAKTIRDTWNDLQKWAPKVGWSASLDIAFLEGSITGGWGYRASSYKHPRIAEIEEYYQLAIKVTLFKCVATISFGIDIQVENWFTGRNLVELILKVSGSIKVLVPLEKEFTSGDAKATPAKISAQSKAELKVIGRAALLDYVYEASASIDGGIAIEGEFKCSAEQDPIAEAKIFMLPLEAHITLTAVGKDPYLKTYECLPKKDIWDGTFPSPT